eukprot:15366864-Ditylum_brightwellii.AAC.1
MKTGYFTTKDWKQSSSDPISPGGDELSPPSHRGCLDAGMIHKLGISHQVIDEKNVYSFIKSSFLCVTQRTLVYTMTLGSHTIQKWDIDLLCMLIRLVLVAPTDMHSSLPKLKNMSIGMVALSEIVSEVEAMVTSTDNGSRGLTMVM